MTVDGPADRVYAHTRPERPATEWEPLEHHLRKVEQLAAGFASVFESRDWGALAGLWHDLGKYKPEFQARLRGAREHVEHAGIGAALAHSRGGAGMALAFAIAGHHAGLANREAQADTRQRSLRERLGENAPELERLRAAIPSGILEQPLPPLPPFLQMKPQASSTENDQLKCRLEMWTRFLFSALVDADFLATEEFYVSRKRDGAQDFDTVSSLRERLDRRLADFRADTGVNRVRAEVLQHSRDAADLPRGLYSLTVPTGGGKTLSSMAFALRHAERHALHRVIVVIPYTSIIEQNAKVYGEYLGAQNVIEHHSNVDEVQRLESNREAEIRRRLAAENWDAHVVVTTNVQFFESLFSNAPSRCRKLHNIARSVVVLDEAQTLPADYLNCALDAIRELVDTYGCSLLLMSATQPALRKREALPFGLADHTVREIVPEPDALAHAMKRVEIHWPSGAQPTPYQGVAEQMRQHEQVLAVVHRRRDARVLAQLLPEEHRFHLSALMCPAHRTEVLTAVKERLKTGSPCRLVATQVVEAGVDIDFPVVLRALAGLDSLAQAAGRCNREGALRDGDGHSRLGQFVVFRAETKPPPGILKVGLESTEALLARHGTNLSFADPRFLEEYFRVLYGKCETDRKGVQSERRQLNFATVAQRVRLIEDGYTRPVIVPWGDALRRLRAFGRTPNRETQRALQPYMVQIPERELRTLISVGAVESVQEFAHALAPAFGSLYDPVFGLIVDEYATPDPAALVA